MKEFIFKYFKNRERLYMIYDKRNEYNYDCLCLDTDNLNIECAVCDPHDEYFSGCERISTNDFIDALVKIHTATKQEYATVLLARELVNTHDVLRILNPF